MDLSEVVRIYAEGLAEADATTPPGSKGYLPGTLTLYENDALAAVIEHWRTAEPSHFAPPNSHHERAVSYPPSTAMKCDHVFTTDGVADEPEWAVEFKRISFIGDNGKRNDYGISKAISPYLKDRGMLHDAARLHAYPLARRSAVLMYAFTYDENVLEEARLRHPPYSDRIDQIAVVLAANGGEPLSPEPLADIVDFILRGRRWLRGSRCEATFEAWRHPCGGRGLVYGWEITNPNSVATNPQHPW